MDSPTPGGAMIHTKLFAPTRRADALARPHILARLWAGRACRLTLLVAPAGSGKTAALAEWIESMAAGGALGAEGPGPPPAARRPPPFRCAWLALDAEDDDPPRFWRYVVQALGPLLPALEGAARPLFSGTQPFSGEAVAALILNQITARPPDPAAPAALVLDDYHQIADPGIHRAVTYLVEWLPPGLRLVIASRVDPPLPLARLRVRGELLELRAADLRFTPEEAAALLRDQMGLALSDAQVATLEARTEGWAAGLQLAALALREQADPAGFIAAFNGSHRHILDYLLDEVLGRQPPHLVTFMLQTAILDRLCGPLCDAVLGLASDQRPTTSGPRDPAALEAGPSAPSDSYSQLLLDQIERANLLLVPLDAERRWFRYHHLLADVLRHRMLREPAVQRATLHRRAAAWLERHDMAEAAIGHYLAGAAPADAARLVVGRDPLRRLAQGEAAQVAGWLGALPEVAIRARPTLCLIQARLLLRARRPDALIEGWLSAAEAGMAATGPEPGVRAEIAATRAHLAIGAGRYQEAAARCAEALDQLDPDDGFGKAALTFMRGNALNTYDYAAAERAYAEAALLGRAHGNARAAVMSLVNRALLAEQRADLPAAEGLLQQAIALTAGAGDRPLPTAQAAYRLLGLVAYERDQLDIADRHLAVAVTLARQSEQVFPLAMALSAQAQQRLAQGDPVGALAALDQARMVTDAAGLHAYAPLLEARRAQIALRQGDLPAAAAWAATFDPAADWRPRSHDGRNNLRGLHLAYIEVQIGLGRPDAALALLARLLELAEAEQSPARAVEALALRALALQGRDGPAALRELERALALALPAGSRRVFRDAGPSVAALVDQMIPSMLDLQPAARSPQPAARSPQPLVEPLTPRELEVLRQLAAGLSSSEIAERLIVSVNTVKTQLKSVYGKLDAHSRSAALARARALGLLQP